MAKQRFYNFNGIDTKLSPFVLPDSDVLRIVNADSEPIGAITKRPGYVTFLGTPDNANVDSLWDWHWQNGTQFYLYRASGGTVYYSTQGTGAWTVCGNGTMTAGARIGYGILGSQMIIGDGTAATRHSSDGINFTNTPAAPLSNYFSDYQGRMYAIGTNSIFYSTTGTLSDWTTDSSSIDLPGPGSVIAINKVAANLTTYKNQGQIYRWDGYNLTDVSTNLGPSSPWSIAKIEDFSFYLNPFGVFGYNGVVPQLMSFPIERQIYNDANTGVAGSVFNVAPGVTHIYDYWCWVGTTTDDLTTQTVSECIEKYDYRHNHWVNFTFNDKPTAWCSFRDNTGIPQLIFGGTNGQCFQYGGTATSDNGAAIPSVVEGVTHFGAPEMEKKFFHIWAFFNPGAQCRFQVAISNTVTNQKLEWIDLGDCSDGVAEMRFPEGSRGRLMSWRITESSTAARWVFYGFTCDVEPIERR